MTFRLHKYCSISFRLHRFDKLILGSVLISFLTPNAASPQLNNLRFKRFGTEYGFSSYRVPAIFQDKKGFMWFATENGVQQYDGYAFRIFKPVDLDFHAGVQLLPIDHRG